MYENELLKGDSPFKVMPPDVIHKKKHTLANDQIIYTDFDFLIIPPTYIYVGCGKLKANIIYFFSIIQ